MIDLKVKILTAFTMAEILISLTIIGIIAAITLPSLQANINESAWRTQRKAFYSRLSQAIGMLPSMNGYGEYEGSWSADSVTVIKDTAVQAFVTDGLAKVLKISNICDNNNFDKCGLPTKYTNITGSKINFPKNLGEYQPYFNKALTGYSDYINPQKHINTNAAAFETVNGEHVIVFYNPSCVSRDVKYTMNTNEAGTWKDPENIFPYFCANFMFDLNGKKGPNKFGKDIWVITSLYSVEPSVVMLDPDKLTKRPTNSMKFNDAKQYCASQNARMANVDEGIAGHLSKIGFGWIGTDTGETDRAYVIVQTGSLIKYPKETSSGIGIRCIKR